MSAGIAVLNRSLKEVPYAVVLFFHSFFGIFASSTMLGALLISTERSLKIIDFAPIDDLLLFGATGLDAISVMSQTIAF